MSYSKRKTRTLPFPLPAAVPTTPTTNPQRTTAQAATIVGTLIVDDSRKGTPLITNDRMTVFLDESYLKTEPGKQAAGWNNKTVEAKGTLVTKQCDPQEQCLSDGTLHFLQNISYISLVEK